MIGSAHRCPSASLIVPAAVHCVALFMHGGKLASVMDTFAAEHTVICFNMEDASCSRTTAVTMSTSSGLTSCFASSNSTSAWLGLHCVRATPSASEANTLLLLAAAVMIDLGGGCEIACLRAVPGPCKTTGKFPNPCALGYR